MPTAQAATRYLIADLALDVGQRRVTRGSDEIDMTDRLFRLLRVLVEHAPAVVTHDELADEVWGSNRVVTPENLTQHIALLRRKLGDDAAAPRYVEVVRGAGYRLVPAVRQGVTSSPRRYATISAVVLAIAAVAFVAARYLPETALDRAPHDGTARSGHDTAIAPGQRSVVVLPFVNESADAEQGFFSDGLTDELINRLSQAGGLRVIGRTSSFALKGGDADAREIGVLLDVAHLLEGSVRRSGDTIRVSAQLVSTADGYQLWAETYDRQMGDIFAVQQDIANSVAEALHGALHGTVPGNEFYGLPGTTDAEAYERYLRAQGLHQAGGTANLQRAEVLLREAIGIDPDFVAGRVVLARTIGLLRQLVPARAEALSDEWAEIMGSVALALPDHPVVHVAHGLEQTGDGDWVGAERSFIAARDRSPPGPLLREIELLLADLARCTGRVADALKHSRLAVRSDPLSLGDSTALQDDLYATGLVDEAEAEYVRSRDLQGDRLDVETIALMRAVVERFDRDRIARRLARVDRALHGGESISRIIISDLDNRDAALATLRDALEAPGAATTPPMLVAWWADHYDDTALALDGLHRSIEPVHRLPTGIWSPAFRNTRRTPGFRTFVREQGLVRYWTETGHWSDFCRPLDSGDFECS